MRRRHNKSKLSSNMLKNGKYLILIMIIPLLFVIVWGRLSPTVEDDTLSATNSSPSTLSTQRLPSLEKPPAPFSNSPWGEQTLPMPDDKPSDDIPEALFQIRDEIIKTLDQMGEGILTHDMGKYTEHISGMSINHFSEQFYLMIYSEKIPFSSAKFELVDTSQSKSDMFQGRALWHLLRLEFKYTLAGIPDEIFKETLLASFVESESGDAWELAAVKRFEEPFWLREETNYVQSPHFLIFYHNKGINEVAQVETQLEEAYAFLQETLADQIEPMYVVYLVEDDEEIGRMTGRPTALRMLGISVARYKFTPGIGFNAYNPAFFLNRTALLSKPPDLWEITIRHELVHLILTDWTLPYLPPWLSEGTAIYYSGEDFWPRAMPWFESGELMTISIKDMGNPIEVGNSDPTRQRVFLEYSYAYVITSYLIETYGEAAYLDFYLSFADIPLDELEAVAPAVETSDTWHSIWRDWAFEHQIKQSYNLTLTELEEAVRVWVQAKAKEKKQ